MIIRPLEPGDPALDAIERMLVESHQANLASFGTLSAKGTLVLAGFVDDHPVGFGLFRNYRDPDLHVGSHIDLDQIQDILQMEEIGLYQIALLHAEQQADLVATTEALILAFEQWLVARYERYCLFIALLKRGNRLARPLYKRLGFKKAGRPSFLMQLNLDRQERFLQKIAPLPGELELRFFDEVGDQDHLGFARCYSQVFLRDSAMDTTAVLASLSRVTSAPDFDPLLSCLLRTRDKKEVVGFMLAQRPKPLQPHFMVVGLLPEYRGQRLPLRCFPFVARRAMADDLKKVTFVTTQSRVVRLAMRAFGAHEVDTLQTHIKVG